MRSFALAAGILLLAPLAACGSGDDQAAGTGWTFTDGRGITVTAPETPKRIVAQVSAAAALKDFGVRVTGTFGPLTRSNGTVEPEAGSLVPAEVTDVTGPEYGTLNLERLGSLDPDLLVSGKYAEFPGLWHLLEDQEEKAKQFAPTVGIQQSGADLPATIGRYAELARRLGGDVDSERVRADQRAFEAAAQRLRTIGDRMRAANRSILAVGGVQGEYFVVVPARNPDLAYYVQGLGLPIRTPDKPDTAGGGYFERLAWEQADRYQGDVLMWDTRPASLPPDQLKANPVFAAMPAAKADRFVEWDAVAPLSYASYARIMTKLADQLDAKLTGLL
ncbi:ABC transporter substrate-binding protein [Amycolatopsis suaedae]|uniref:Ferrichrome ABC transporter substrate-binding protein n=1 Tax=Amycolatopsis suaedae TaxID=2510978 RepID=A0A4Q7JCX3_9PSEU|nr:ABC transporter substrate-binding protein [Amycolatopsis suaedae]RZQ64184.1 ferrichrome ABC transporter substrate-binding protein [Amycolatopsis suaedae]